MGKSRHQNEYLSNQSFTQFALILSITELLIINAMQSNNYLLFEVGGHKYAVDILDVDSIHSSNRDYADNNMEDCRLAVRIFKKLVPIIDMRQRLNIQSMQKPIQPSIIFMKSNTFPDDIIGIQVDSTLDIHEIKEDDKFYENECSYIPLSILSNVERIQIINTYFLNVRHENAQILTEILN